MDKMDKNSQNIQVPTFRVSLRKDRSWKVETLKCTSILTHLGIIFFNDTTLSTSTKSIVFKIGQIWPSWPKMTKIFKIRRFEF